MSDVTREGFIALQKTQPYKDWANGTAGNKIDAGKLDKKLHGESSPKPGSGYGLALWRMLDALTPAPPPPPPPPPPVKKLAPQTYNRGSSGQDARYCTNAPGVTKLGPNDWVDEGGFHYDASGLCRGGRSGQNVPGLKPSDQMDGHEPCDPYNGMPPWPPKSYEV